MGSRGLDLVFSHTLASSEIHALPNCTALQVDNSTPRAARGFVDRYVRAEGGGLRQVVLDRLVTFVEEFNSK